MKIGIISDIHSNREALVAVLEALAAAGVDRILCLGDVVGYGPDPDYCILTVLARCAAVVRGNHDKAVAGLADLGWFNSIARQAALWTRGALDSKALAAIRDLRTGPREMGQGVMICHGAPHDEDAYLLNARDFTHAYSVLDAKHQQVRICFHGHTHTPIVVARRPGKSPAILLRQERTDLEPGLSYLINPGSVGQPRDGNPLASFGILDTSGRVYTNLRVEYAIRDTVRKILDAGLPADLAYRLSQGR